METRDPSNEQSGPADDTPDFGEGPDSPEEGHPVDETSPQGGLDPGSQEHPEDIRQPPDEEGDETSTESPASPPGS